MPRTAFFISLLVFAGAAGTAQNRDSLRAIEKEILGRDDTEVNLLAKTRDALRDAVLSEDVEQIDRLMRFVVDRFDTRRIVPLYQHEGALLDLWRGAYANVLAISTAPEDEPSYGTVLSPPRDRLFDDIREHSRRRKPMLERQLRASGLDPKHEDFLGLFLDYLLGPDPNRASDAQSHQDRLNAKADRVLAQHSDSEHNVFIRRWIRFVLKPSPWGFGLSMSIGPSTLLGGLSTYFTDPTRLDFVFEGTYGQLYGAIDVGAAFGSRVRSAFTASDGKPWKQGLEVQPLSLLVSGGYRLQEIGPLTVTPYAGFGYWGIEPPEQDRVQPGNDVSHDMFTVGAGVNVDLPIGSMRFLTRSLDGEEYGYWFVRVRATWQTAITDDPFQKGSMWSVTVGLGGFGRTVERD